jgi:uncharacterized protein with NRDE domain
LIIENLVLWAKLGFNGFAGEDDEKFWNTEVLQNIKFQAPNYKQISNSNIEVPCSKMQSR